jgi:hypothetical protein
MQKYYDSNLSYLFFHWGGWSSYIPCVWVCYTYMSRMTSTHLAALSFPLAIDILRAPDPLPAFRSPEFASLDAATNLDTEPDFAKSARTAGIQMEPLGPFSSLLRVVYRTKSMFEASSFDRCFPIVCALSSSDVTTKASESELSIC